MIAVKGDIILVEIEISTEKLNNFFSEAVENLNIELYLTDNMENQFTCNLQEKLDKYDDHPSIKIINENVITGHKFSFSDITIQDFDDEIIKFDAKKAVLDDDIPTKVLITTHDIVSNYLSMYYNDAKNNHNSAVI